MIHDLTANSDFTSSSRLRLNFRLPDRSYKPNPEDELVFTGDALERESKRFHVDYNTDKTICDCCGGYIDKIPWHWNDTNKTICNICEKILRKNYRTAAGMMNSMNSVFAQWGESGLLVWDGKVQPCIENKGVLQKIVCKWNNSSVIPVIKTWMPKTKHICLLTTE